MRQNNTRSRRSHASPAGDLTSKSKSRKSRSRGALELSNISSDLGLSEENLENIVPHNDRRYQVCMEMLNTERNYVEDLELIVTVSLNF